MFYVGQKVVCVRSWGTRNREEYECPVKGVVYTVREFVDIGTEPSLRVCEIHNSPIAWANVEGLVEPSWVRHAFRPMVERKTDISVFTALLDPANQTCTWETI